MSFLRPKIPAAPTPVAPPPAPTIDVAAQAAEDANRLRRRRGRASYIFGGKAAPAPVMTGTKTLTGQ